MNIGICKYIKAFSQLLLVIFLGCVYIPYSEAQEEILHDIELQKSRLYSDRATKTRYVNVALKNVSSAPISGEVAVVIDTISTPKVTINNADGINSEGKPFFSYNTHQLNVELLPNEVTAEKKWVFNNPDNLRFSYETKIYRMISPASNPSIKVLNPIPNATTAEQNPKIVVALTGITDVEPNNISITLDGNEISQHFEFSENLATTQLVNALAEGDHSLSVSLITSDAQSILQDIVFSVKTSDIESRYLFSLNNNSLVFSSAGNGTYHSYVTNTELGIKPSDDIQGFSFAGDQSSWLFINNNLDEVFQSSGDGTNKSAMSALDLGLTGDDVLTGISLFKNHYYFTTSNNQKIFKSTANGGNEIFKDYLEIGIPTNSTINCLHKSPDNKVFFCLDGKIVFQADTGGAVIPALTVADLGVPKNSINAFALFPDMTKPEISITQPKNGITTNNPVIDMVIDYADQDSGIDLESFVAELDGVDISTLFDRSSTQATLSQPNNVGAELLTHQFKVSIKDLAGNSNNIESSYHSAALQALPSVDKVAGSSPLKVNFDTLGLDPAGEIVRYQWDFDGDGVFDTDNDSPLPQPYTYQFTGNYLANLQVTSNTGAQAIKGIDISVFDETSANNAFSPLNITASIEAKLAFVASPEDWMVERILSVMLSKEIAKKFAESGIFKVKIAPQHCAYAIQNMSISMGELRNLTEFNMLELLWNKIRLLGTTCQEISFVGQLVDGIQLQIFPSDTDLNNFPTWNVALIVDTNKLTNVFLLEHTIPKLSHIFSELTSNHFVTIISSRSTELLLDEVNQELANYLTQFIRIDPNKVSLKTGVNVFTDSFIVGPLKSISDVVMPGSTSNNQPWLFRGTLGIDFINLLINKISNSEYTQSSQIVGGLALSVDMYIPEHTPFPFNILNNKDALHAQIYDSTFSFDLSTATNTIVLDTQSRADYWVLDNNKNLPIPLSISGHFEINGAHITGSLNGESPMPNGPRSISFINNIKLAQISISNNIDFRFDTINVESSATSDIDLTIEIGKENSEITQKIQSSMSIEVGLGANLGAFELQMALHGLDNQGDPTDIKVLELLSGITNIDKLNIPANALVLKEGIFGVIKSKDEITPQVYLNGGVHWAALNVDADVAIVNSKVDDKKVMFAFLHISDFNLADLLPQTDTTATARQILASAKFSDTAIILNTLSGSKDISIHEFPESIQPILFEIIKGDRQIESTPIALKGGSLLLTSAIDFSGVNESIISNAFQNIGFDGLGINSPLIIQGYISGLPTGTITPLNTLEMSLTARLPGFTLPSTLPNPINGEIVHNPISNLIIPTNVELFIDLKQKLISAELRAGIRGSMDLNLPDVIAQSGSPVELNGEYFIKGEVGKEGLVMSGNLVGNVSHWQSPFNIDTLTFDSLDITGELGINLAKAELAQTLGFGGTSTLTLENGETIQSQVAFVRGIALMLEPPFIKPKSVGGVFAIDEWSLDKLVEMSNAVMKGMLNGPFSQLYIDRLPENKRFKANAFKEAILSHSLSEILNLNSLPLNNLAIIPATGQDKVLYYFSTPGAEVPSAEDIGLGIKLSGAGSYEFLGLERGLGELNLSITSEGFSLRAEMESFDFAGFTVGWDGATNQPRNPIINILAVKDQPAHFKAAGGIRIDDGFEQNLLNALNVLNEPAKKLFDAAELALNQQISQIQNKEAILANEKSILGAENLALERAKNTAKTKLDGLSAQLPGLEKAMDEAIQQVLGELNRNFNNAKAKVESLNNIIQNNNANIANWQHQIQTMNDSCKNRICVLPWKLAELARLRGLITTEQTAKIANINALNVANGVLNLAQIAINEILNNLDDFDVTKHARILLDGLKASISVATDEYNKANNAFDQRVTEATSTIINEINKALIEMEKQRAKLAANLDKLEEQFPSPRVFMAFVASHANLNDIFDIQHASFDTEITGVERVGLDLNLRANFLNRGMRDYRITLEAGNIDQSIKALAEQLMNKLLTALPELSELP